MSLRQALHPLEPAHLAAAARRIAAKLARKARRLDLRVVRLRPAGPARGAVLFSYILDPFVQRPGAAIPTWHTHFWESHRMALSFVERGFQVDAISWTNRRFLPELDYDFVVDVRLNLERLAPFLPPGCVKVAHLDTAHHLVNNGAQRVRLEQLAARRGCRLAATKLMPENRAIETADCATLLGNRFTRETYAFAGKPLHRIPISTTVLHPWPVDKDFDRARHGFLWLGSGGLVHKGLDLVLEAFASMPDQRLIVCGPIRRERDFERCYFRELYETPNIRTLGWVDVGGAAFRDLAAGCLGVVYPSCSEGGGGSVVASMHAGLVPVVSYEASVDVADDFGVLLLESSVAAIQQAVRRLSSRPAAELEGMARRAWTFARERHTRDAFAAAYQRFVGRLIDGDWRQGDAVDPAAAEPCGKAEG